MVEVIWAQPALDDLNRIAEYFALTVPTPPGPPRGGDIPVAARRLVRKVFARVDRLRAFPKSGSIPAETRGLPYRQIVVPPCRVFYRPERKRVLILHVMRGEQLFRIDALLEGESRIED